MATVPPFFWQSDFSSKDPGKGQGSRFSTAMCSVAPWFACAVVSGIPFMIGLHMSFTDAVFEEWPADRTRSL